MGPSVYFEDESPAKSIRDEWTQTGMKETYFQISEEDEDEAQEEIFKVTSLKSLNELYIFR